MNTAVPISCGRAARAFQIAVAHGTLSLSPEDTNYFGDFYLLGEYDLGGPHTVLRFKKHRAVSIGEQIVECTSDEEGLTIPPSGL